MSHDATSEQAPDPSTAPETGAAPQGDDSPLDALRRERDALQDRLLLNAARIEGMARGLDDIVALPDPVGAEIERWTRPNGLDIARIATPIGVIGIIYESRPNVTADAGAIALKAGNVAILRGGSDSVHSAGAIHAAMVEGLQAAGLPESAIQYVRNTDREAVGMMLEISAVAVVGDK